MDKQPVTAAELEAELERFARDTAHLRNGKPLKLDAHTAAYVIAKYLSRKTL